MATYIAVVHGAAGNYGISLPDLPGCTSGGATIDDALDRIRIAATEWMDEMAGSGAAVPAPRSVDALLGDPEYHDDVADAALIAAIELEPPARAVRLNISLDEGLLARIDRDAAAVGETRSGWLATAARHRLSRPAGAAIPKRKKKAG